MSQGARTCNDWMISIATNIIGYTCKVGVRKHGSKALTYWPSILFYRIIVGVAYPNMVFGKALIAPLFVIIYSYLLLTNIHIYIKHFLYLFSWRNKYVNMFIITVSMVGIWAPPACADETGRQQESGGERDHRLKRCSTAWLNICKIWY